MIFQYAFVVLSDSLTTIFFEKFDFISFPLFYPCVAKKRHASIDLRLHLRYTVYIMVKKNVFLV